VIVGEVRDALVELDGRPAQLSCLPDRRGRTWWFLTHGGGSWSELSADEQRDAQCDWLQCLRLENHVPPAAAGVSRRTWEGWEQGRPLPFAIALRLALGAWDDRRHPASARQRTSA
jgi:hypothetical protein